MTKGSMRNLAGAKQSDRGRLSVRIAHARVGASWGLKALLKFPNPSSPKQVQPPSPWHPTEIKNHDVPPSHRLISRTDVRNRPF